MKYLLLISFLLPFMTWAQVPETAASEENLFQNLLDNPNKLENYRQDQMRKWMPLSLQYGTTPYVPFYISTATDEPEFFKEYPTLIKQFDHFPNRVFGDMSQNFETEAFNAFTACGIDKKLKNLSSRTWDKLNKNYYSVTIITVPFNLCQDANSSDCSFESSFAAKNFPALKLILVNAAKWNIMNENQRMSLAVHEFLGVFGVEESTYGLSSTIDSGSIVKNNPNGFQEWYYCNSGN